MFGISFQEFVFFALVIVLLSGAGLLQPVLNALREIRTGKPAAETAARHAATPGNLDISFRLLGLSPSATLEEIERAYRNKAKVHHPDLGGDDDTMRALNEAYNLIKKTRRTPTR